MFSHLVGLLAQTVVTNSCFVSVTALLRKPEENR